MNQAIIHGIPVKLPEGWDDWSIIKLVAPETQTPRPNHQPLAANVILQRQPRLKNKPLRELLDDSNQAFARQTPSFHVLASGTTRYFGNEAAWQDSSQNAKGLLVFQRHVVIARSEDEVLLITMTGDQKDLDRISRNMDFETQPSEPPPDNSAGELRPAGKSDRAAPKKARPK